MDQWPVPLHRAAPVVSLAKHLAGAAVLGLAAASWFGFAACSGAAATPAPAAPAGPPTPTPPLRRRRQLRVHFGQNACSTNSRRASGSSTSTAAGFRSAGRGGAEPPASSGGFLLTAPGGLVEFVVEEEVAGGGNVAPSRRRRARAVHSGGFEGGVGTNNLEVRPCLPCLLNPQDLTISLAGPWALQQWPYADFLPLIYHFDILFEEQGWLTRTKL